MNKLIILIKNVEPGKVKTRIAKTMGHDEAMRIYRELLEHTRSVALATDCERNLYYSPRIIEQDEWDKATFSKKLQTEGDLGEKISAAFENEIGENHRVIIIGSDCGELSEKILSLAFAKLEKYDVVLGPTFDGGYYLLGMKTFMPELFKDIPWSTAKVYPLTLTKVLLSGKTFFEMPMLNDIDHEEDYLQWKAKQ